MCWLKNSCVFHANVAIVTDITPLGPCAGVASRKRIMKRTRGPKTYPDWRQREIRMLYWALAVGGVAAAITGLVIYFANHSRNY
jgi:hypothetical protein